MNLTFNTFPHIDAFWRLCSSRIFENKATKEQFLCLSPCFQLYSIIVLSFKGCFQICSGMFFKVIWCRFVVCGKYSLYEYLNLYIYINIVQNQLKNEHLQCILSPNYLFPTYRHLCSRRLLKTPWQKAEIAQNEQFLLLSLCFSTLLYDSEGKGLRLTTLFAIIRHLKMFNIPIIIYIYIYIYI